MAGTRHPPSYPGGGNPCMSRTQPPFQQSLFAPKISCTNTALDMHLSRDDFGNVQLVLQERPKQEYKGCYAIV